MVYLPPRIVGVWRGERSRPWLPIRTTDYLLFRRVKLFEKTDRNFPALGTGCISTGDGPSGGGSKAAYAVAVAILSVSLVVFTPPPRLAAGRTMALPVDLAVLLQHGGERYRMWWETDPISLCLEAACNNHGA